MSSQASPSKKRKRADSTSDQLSVSVYDKSPSAVGPVLVTFPAVEPPKSTAFAIYASPQKARKNDVEQDREEEFSRRSLSVAGETETIEFYSTGDTETARRGCRYLVGVHNKRTNALLLRPSPLQIFGRRVKALKNLAPLPSTSLSQSDQDRTVERMEQRAALGEIFGTKKAQKAIRAAERNRVDVSAMEDVVEHIQESVELGTKSLPTQEEAKEVSDSSRQIPKFDLKATCPEDVYKVHDIVPESELRAVPIKDLKNASPEQRMKCIPGPFGQSKWMKAHLERVFSSGDKPSRRKLRILMYIAILLTFRAGAPRYCARRWELEQRLPGVPSIIIDGIYSRFTETVRGGTATKFTRNSAVRLLTHVFALCLHMDNFVTDTIRLTLDLQESALKVDRHFRLLGCKFEKFSRAELNRLGLSATTSEEERAVLRVPLVFPKPRVRRKTAAY